MFDDMTVEKVTAGDGRLMWRFSDGTMLPVVRGGSDDGGESGEGGNEGSGEGEGSSGESSGESEGSGESKPSGEDVAKWKSLARKHESEAKKLRAEADKLRASSQTDAEKAVETAKAEGRQAAQLEFGQRLAGAEIKAALTGVVPNPAEIVEDLNLAKYVTDDGEVDGEAVAALKKKYEGFARQGRPGPDLGQGRRGDAPAGKDQLTKADLDRMTPEQIVKARREGRLDDLAKGKGVSGVYGAEY